MVLGIPFLIFSNLDIQFVENKLEWRNYTTVEVLSTIKKVELIDKKEFAAVPIDENVKTFLIYIAILSAALVI